MDLPAGCRINIEDKQAPWFYPKFAYAVFGTLDYPPGQQRFLMRKRLIAEEA